MIFQASSQRIVLTTISGGGKTSLSFGFFFSFFSVVFQGCGRIGLFLYYVVVVQVSFHFRVCVSSMVSQMLITRNGIAGRNRILHGLANCLHISGAHSFSCE